MKRVRYNEVQLYYHSLYSILNCVCVFQDSLSLYFAKAILGFLSLPLFDKIYVCTYNTSVYQTVNTLRLQILTGTCFNEFSE